MPAPLLVQSQLQALETGLKTIKHSQVKLLQQPEMRTMYAAIEKHHQDIKLAHLTGKPKDLIQQAEQDTKFYYILIRMLGEVINSDNHHQRSHMRSVYKWYKENKHILNTGPRFGMRKKVNITRATSYDSLEASFEKLLLEINTDQNDLKVETFGSVYSENKENFSNEENDIDEEVDKIQPPTKAIEQAQPRRPSDPKQGNSFEHLLLKRKTVPLSHLFNPHARQMAEIDKEASDKTAVSEVASPVKLMIGKKASLTGQKDEKLNPRKKWDAFQQEYNYGQDVLSKLQHTGRSGIPGAVRYTAHDHGLMAEDFTRDIVIGYMEYEQIKSLYDCQEKADLSTNAKNLLTDAKLEQFYELASMSNPSKLPKFPNFGKIRAKSAPVLHRPKSGKKLILSGKLGARGLDSSLQDDTGKSILPHTKPTEQDALAVKLDIVVNMIDSVTEEMSYYKEKLAPEPHPGFRQPTVPVDPAQRPHTAPAGSIARPTSPEEHDLLTARSSTVEAIDWRGKITPDFSRYRIDTDSVGAPQTESTRWSTTPLGSHTYVKKSQQAKSSLRTSGSTHAGHRPRTAPNPTLGQFILPQSREGDQFEPPANHQVDLDSLHEIVQVQHLGGKHKSKKRSKYLKLNYDYFMDKDMKSNVHTSSDDQTGPVMEYMSISTPKSIKDDHRNGSSYRLTHEDDSALTIPQAGPELDDSNSLLQGELDGGPNMTDFEGGEKEETNQTQTDLVTNNTNGRELLASQNQVDNATEGAGEDNTQLLDDIRKLLGRDSLYDGNGDDVSQPSAPNRDCWNPSEASEDQSGSFVTASQRTPVRVEPQQQQHTVVSKPGQTTKQKQPLSKSTYWSYVPQLEFTNQDIEEHIHDVERDFILTSPRHHPKTKLGRAFPRAPSAPVCDDRGQVQSSLSVEGIGTGMRARSAGTVPPRAKTNDRHMVLIKQKEMLRKSSAKVFRTAPSIPNPFNPYGTRSPRQGTTYSCELEMHATRDSSPRHYLQKVGHLRNDDVKQYDNNYTGEMRPLTSAIKVMRMRPKGQRETPSPMECILQGHPGTPVESLGDDTDGVKHYINDQSSACSANNSSRKSVQDSSRQRYIDMGRPIPDNLEHVEPDDYYSAVERQQRAKAAVNIQRIFRGYVARNWYKYLQREYRENMENQQMAAVEIQKAYRRHLACKKAIAKRRPNPETLLWAKNYKVELMEKQAERELKAQTIAITNAKKKAAANAKLAIIGPHVDVYVPFHPKHTGPEKWLLNAAATAIQRHIRGWLVRMKLARLKRKSKLHGGSWNNFIRCYKDLIFKIQRRLGIERPKFYFSFDIIDDFMDTKKRFECVFDKKAFSNELETDELLSFFNECDLYPAQTEIQDAITTMFKGQPKKTALLKQQVLEVAFQIYPPKGTGIPSNRQSTWMTPIIDGEEATRLMGTDGVEPTDFETCWNLVSSSHRQRVLEEQEEQAVMREEKWKKSYGMQPASRCCDESALKQTLKPLQVTVIPEEDESSILESQKSSENDNILTKQDPQKSSLHTNKELEKEKAAAITKEMDSA